MPVPRAVVRCDQSVSRELCVRDTEDTRHDEAHSGADIPAKSQNKLGIEVKYGIMNRITELSAVEAVYPRAIHPAQPLACRENRL